MTTAQPDILAIFNTAAAIPSDDERRQYLDQACANDAQARDRVVALLRAHFGAGSFLGGPMPAAAATIDRPAGETAGAQIGPYKLLQEIAEGGMGIVYMAEQIHPVERRVALKIIKPGMDSRQVIARFEAERQALALMDHPNIAKILDAGTTGSGRPYFVMELVRGTPITKYCDDAQLTTRERLELFLPVCHAVQHAHHKGVIHRDIKPGNVLVALYDDRAVPKVIDFGVAKATHKKLTDKTMFTRFGEVVGTLEYMSPEQAQLNQLDIDTRSDVYSLGVLLYELLTGCTPFDKQRLHTAAFEEVLRIIREEDPPKPSTRLSAAKTLPEIAAKRRVEPQQLKHLVRGELDWSIMKALEKDRSRRYDSAGSFADDIRRHLNGEPILACPTSTSSRIRKFARRHRIGICAAGTIACIMLLATLVSSWYAYQAIAARDAAELSLEAERTARHDAEAAQRQTVSALEDADVQRSQAEHSLYIAHMNQAWQAWKDGNLHEAQRLVQLHFNYEEHAGHGHGFEWRFLRDLCRPKGHLATYYLSGSPAALSLSPNGKQLAVCDVDGEVSVFNTESHEGYRHETCYRGTAVQPPYHAYVSFSADGRYLISPGEEPSEPIILDRSMMSRRALFAPSSAAVLYACFRPTCDTAQLVVAREDGTVSVLADCESGEVVHTWHVICDLLVFSPDGRYLAGVAVKGVAESGEVTVWDMSDFRAVMTIPVDIPVREVAFSPDSKLLAAIHAQNTRGVHSAVVWRVPEGVEFSRGPDHQGFAGCVAFLADGTMATGGRDNAVRLVDVASGRELRQIRGHSSYVTQLATMPIVSEAHTQVIATAGSDNRVMLWQVDANPRDLLVFGSDHPVSNQITTLVFTPDGKTLLGMRLSDHHVYQWDVNSLKQVASWQTDLSLLSLAVSRNHMVAAGCRGGTVLLWSLFDQGKKLQLQGGAHPLCIEFSPDGSLLATPGKHSLLVWNVQTQHLNTIPTPLADTFDLEWSTNGGMLALAGYKSVVVFDTSDWAVISHLTDNKESVRAVSFSRDGRLLATGGFDSTISVWDTKTWRLLRAIRTHSGYVWSVVFSQDNHALLSASGDDRVAVWDVETGNQRLLFDAHVDGAKALALSPDESLLATGGLYDGTVRLWRAPAAQGDEARPSIFQDSEMTAVNARIASAPDRVDLLLQRVRLSMAHGDSTQAQTDLEQVLRISPGDPVARSALARLCWGQGKPDEMLVHLQHVPVGSVDRDLCEQRMRLLLCRARWDEAAADANQLLDRFANERGFNSERSVFIELLLRQYPQVFAKLQELRPADSHLSAVQARDFAQQSEWGQAAAIFAKIIDACPPGEEWYENAALRLLIGDRQGYDEFVARLLTRASDTKDPLLTYAVTRTLALASPPVVDSEQLANWAARTMAFDNIDWKLHTAGLACYRAGQHERAVEHFLASLKGGWTDAGVALNHLGLAMAYHRLARHDESRACLEKAVAWGDAIEALSVEGRRGICPLDWLEYNLLRREATEMLARNCES